MEKEKSVVLIYDSEEKLLRFVNLDHFSEARFYLNGDIEIYECTIWCNNKYVKTSDPESIEKIKSYFESKCI